MEKKLFYWLMVSNRLQHLVYGSFAAIVGTILFTAGLAVGMEFKDKQYGNEFDWLDIAATLIGGAIGQAIQIVLILLFLGKL